MGFNVAQAGAIERKLKSSRRAATCPILKFTRHADLASVSSAKSLTGGI